MPVVGAYSAAEDATILRMRRDGATWIAIAKVIGRPSGFAVRFRAVILYQRIEDELAAPVVTLRKCLRCRGDVHSTGHGHRMCDPCRERSSSPFEPEHAAGQRKTRYAPLGSDDIRPDVQ